MLNEKTSFAVKGRRDVIVCFYVRVVAISSSYVALSCFKCCVQLLGDWIRFRDSTSL